MLNVITMWESGSKEIMLKVETIDYRFLINDSGRNFSTRSLAVSSHNTPLLLFANYIHLLFLIVGSPSKLIL